MNNRNITIDVVRGFAMLLVVLGHTISGTVKEYSNSLLFQAIWTLQMPLFIVISGYVTRYSRPIVDCSGLWKFIKKRTLAYLLPWGAWTIVVRGLIFGQSNMLNIKNLLWHMDNGYWFLVTIWTISMIYGISDLLSNKWFKERKMNVFVHLFFLWYWIDRTCCHWLFYGIRFFCHKTYSLLFTYIYSWVYVWTNAKLGDGKS